MIICNTTPLINFAEIGRLDLLESMFGTLVIPPAVQTELEAKAVLFPLAAKAASAGFVSVLAPHDELLMKGLAVNLHPGEAGCLTLAMEHPGSLLIIDEIAAREFAARSGLLFTGTLGCLARAKQQGLLPAIEPLLQELRTKARFWISNQLEERVLRDAGER